MSELEANGYHVSRSAASKGKFDVIAVNDTEVLFVQVKRTKSSYRVAQKKDLKKLRAVVVPNSPIIKKQLWCWLDHVGWKVTTV
jgi:Holliday junction resolvase